MEADEHGREPTGGWDDPGDEDDPPTHLAATFASVVALVAGLGVTVWLLLVAVAESFCVVGGGHCSPGDERRAGLASVGAAAVFLGVPALVALARRDARWLSVPFVEVIVVFGTATVVAVVA